MERSKGKSKAKTVLADKSVGFQQMWPRVEELAGYLKSKKRKAPKFDLDMTLEQLHKVLHEMKDKLKNT